MIRVAALLLALVLTGCTTNVEINTDQWQCTRTGTVLVTRFVGKISVTNGEPRCTQWTRFAP